VEIGDGAGDDCSLTHEPLGPARSVSAPADPGVGSFAD